MRVVDNIIWGLKLPFTPRNIRMSAISVAIFQVLISHLILFIVLLSLSHAEEIKILLANDIEDQKESGIYYETAPNSFNHIRLRKASQLVAFTEYSLYLATGIASVYLFACLGLFVGVFKNRGELLIPWLILDAIKTLLIQGCWVLMLCPKIVEIFGGEKLYWFTGFIFGLFSIIIWFVILAYYVYLGRMKKLTEIATVAIPCPAPGSIPFHYRKENMYLGSGGYKHILTDGDPNQGV